MFPNIHKTIKKEKNRKPLIRKIVSWFRSVFFIVLIFQAISCVDSAAPEFDFLDGLVYIDGFASTSPEASFVNLNISGTDDFGNFTNKFIPDATVTFKNVATNEIVFLLEDSGVYVPPSGFVVATGDIWKLEITLPDGSTYESDPEKVLTPIPITSIDATYDAKLFYNEALNKFAPGHYVSVNIQDPDEEGNYYFWNFRSFENLRWCEWCENGVFREGKCLNRGNTNYSYRCDSDCWRIRYSEEIKVFSDEFTNGTTISDLRVANIPLFNKEDIVVELQQFSLSLPAYEYYKIINDLVDNSGNLNAPPPAALIGNMFNPTNVKERVLGRFTAAATSTASVFIDRTNIRDTQIDRIIPRITEMSGPTSADCGENRYRTGIEPAGWIEQN
jgi:hypothetical protein